MHLASSGGRGRKPMERGACVLNVGMKHESPRTASAKSRLPATAALRRAGLLFAFLDLSPRALRHEDTPWNLSAPVQLKCPACRVFVHRARLLRPRTAALCVSVLLLASHTPRSTDSPDPHAASPRPSTARMVDGRGYQSALCHGMMPWPRFNPLGCV